MNTQLLETPKQMDNSKLKRFAQYARRLLLEEVSSKLDYVLDANNNVKNREPRAFKALEDELKKLSKEEVIERVAYTWFNRFCALRFMDLNNYNSIRVVSPLDGDFNPELLVTAKSGYIAPEFLSSYDAGIEITNILDGTTNTKNPMNEAYGLLLIEICKFYRKKLPFLFETINSYTELLIPDDLLSGNSIVTLIRENLYPANCLNADASPCVEVIGWLYQYYISERKDEVFASFKKGKKALAKDLPAATQLFTPHWIVKYLVENSLGRLWMLNKPESRLKEKMKFFIQPEAESDFLKINSVEELRVCDPACGSAHILVYAFDLLYEIYLEEGYSDEAEIVELILTKNLYGIEIDERAGELAAFALSVKARHRDKGFFNHPVKPNICVLENALIEESKLKTYIEMAGDDLFTQDLMDLLRAFREAKNYGALIRSKIPDLKYLRKHLEEKGLSSNLMTEATHRAILKVLSQAEYLISPYHVVIANPPYMGGKNMNPSLASFAKKEYPNTKSDLFAMFIERNFLLSMKQGYLGFMTPFVWMFISSYEKLRNLIINDKSISSLVQLEYSGFDGATVPICTFVCKNSSEPSLKGTYIRLSDFKGAKNQEPKTLEAIQNQDCKWRFTASTEDFKKIPGSPIAYWVSERVREIFEESDKLGDSMKAVKGLDTCDNEKFIRSWHEVSNDCVSFCSDSNFKWFPYCKGGDFRKWFGNLDFVVNWENNGYILKNLKNDLGKIKSRPQNTRYYFREGITFSSVTSALFSCRYMKNSIFGGGGSAIFGDDFDTIIGLLNSKLNYYFIKIMNPTLNMLVGDINLLPCMLTTIELQSVALLINIAKQDWDAYERSWDFKSSPLIDTHKESQNSSLEETYQSLRAKWQSMTDEMLKLEEENNRIFIEAYGLEDELTPEVPLKEITLSCNPHYRYDSKKTSEELEKLLVTDTIREFVSYAVGCIFGRYSLDKEGLILANQGEGLSDYLKQIPEPSFMPDEDNIIPVLESEWFSDDIVARFKKFLKVSFGEANYDKNLSFIEAKLGKDLRKYFLKDFYAEHIKRYKKRPIYWMFSSPKGYFNALIYMHRYDENTVNLILNEYLRAYRDKLLNKLSELERISVSATKSDRDKNQSLKEIGSINKILKDLDDYEHNTLFQLATQKVSIDLDDGVKVNYNKFTGALQKVKGLSD